ncbi:hypothetical protein E1281_25175 [Actinomadura sp. KC345]|uniref:hypothetical protein n=1 Tax=Actinomadura sp. KC345 TaxID=2530371 RepID=UPI00104EE785|nr:hypothetical protein [Actinomadura sp. KC345]TDC48159.1 hypothetical protein E1281_25175 [Actinomadura sp. KC345]
MKPDLHPFDRGRARETVGRLRPAADVPAPPDTRPGLTWVREVVAPWYRAMDEPLTEEYGPWAIGWHWIRLSGGPVSAWGTPAESITTPVETLDRVASALVEWRGFLETLAEIFDGFSVHGGRPGDGGPMWDRAAVRLITLTTERTEANEMWYETYAAVLGWFLSHAGVPEGEAASLIGDAIGGRFSSWVAPEDTVVEEVGGRLAAGLGRRDG